MSVVPDILPEVHDKGAIMKDKSTEVNELDPGKGNLRAIYDHLASKNPQIKEKGFDGFSADMQNDDNLNSVYESLASKNPQIKEKGFDQFKVDMFGDQSITKKKDETESEESEVGSQPPSPDLETLESGFYKGMGDIETLNKQIDELTTQWVSQDPDQFTSDDELNNYNSIISDRDGLIKQAEKLQGSVQQSYDNLIGERTRLNNENLDKQDQLFDALGFTDEDFANLNDIVSENKLEDGSSLRISQVHVDDLSMMLTEKPFDEYIKGKAEKDSRSISERIFAPFKDSVIKTGLFEMPASAAATFSNLMGKLKEKTEGDVLFKAIKLVVPQISKVSKGMQNLQVNALEWGLEHRDKEEFNIGPLNIKNNKELIQSISQIHNPLDVIDFVSSSVGQATVQIIPAIATRGATSFMQEIGHTYMEGVARIAEDKNMSVEDVIRLNLDEPEIARIHGMAQGMMEYFGATKIFKAIKPAAFAKEIRKRGMKWWKSVGSSAGTEGITEFGQGTSQQIAVERMAGAQKIEAIGNVSWFQSLDEGIAGAVGGGGVTIGGVAIRGTAQRINLLKKLRDKGKTRSKEEDELYNEAMDNIVENVKQQGETRDPEEVKTFIEDEILEEIKESDFSDFTVPKKDDQFQVGETSAEDEIVIEAKEKAAEKENIVKPKSKEDATGTSTEQKSSVDKHIEDDEQVQKDGESSVGQQKADGKPESSQTGDSDRTGKSAQEQGKDKPVGELGEGQVKEPLIKVKNTPVENISADVDRFQNREEEFSDTSVKSIVDAVQEGVFDINMFDPVRLWKDPESGQTMILAGHSRVESFKKLQKLLEEEKISPEGLENLQKQGISDFTSIPSVDMGHLSEQDAVKFATEQSNTLATAESDLAGATLYRKKRLSGESDAKIKRDLKGRANLERLKLFNYLNPNGQAVAALKAMEGAETTDNQQRVNQIGEFIGMARLRFSQLTDSHENELYKYLTEGSGKNLTIRGDFITRLDNVVSNVQFQQDPTQPLNMESRITKGSNEQLAQDEYDDTIKRIKELEKERTDKKSPLGPERAKEINRELDKKRIDLIKLQENILKAKQGDRQQIGLFDKGSEIVDRPATVEEVPEKKKSEKIKDDIDNLFDDLDKSLGSTLSSGVNPETSIIAAKIVGKYVELGIVKFGEMVHDVYSRYGEEGVKKYFDAMKAGYGSILATAEDTSAMTPLEDVRNTNPDEISRAFKPQEEAPSADQDVPENELPTGSIELDINIDEKKESSLHLISKSGRTTIADYEYRVRKDDGSPFKIYDSVIDVIKKWNPKATLGQNYTARGADGTFYADTGNVRVTGLNDLSVAMHELSHALDERYDVVTDFINSTVKNDPLRQSFRKIFIQYYPKAKPSANSYKTVIEGYATLIQKYIESPSTIKKEYPGLVDSFIKSNGKYAFEGIEEFIKDAEAIVLQYQALSPLEKIGSRIVNDEIQDEGESFLGLGDKFTREVFDGLHPIEKMAKRDGTYMTSDDVTQLIRLAKNSSQIAHRNITGNKFWNMGDDEQFTEVLDYTFNTIEKSLKKRGLHTDFAAYLVARRIYYEYREVDRMESKLESLQDPAMVEKIAEMHDLDIEQAQVVIDNMIAKVEADKEALEQKLENEAISDVEVSEAFDAGKEMFKTEAAMLDALNDQMVDFAYRTRLIGELEYNKYKNVEGYAPFKRKMYDELAGEEGVPTIKGAGKTKVGSFLMRKGSQKAILNPFIGSMMNHEEILRKGMRQMVYNKFIGVAERNPDLFQVLQLKTSKDPSNRFPQEKDENIIMARDQEGKRVPILASKEIKTVLDENFDYDNLHLLKQVGIGASQIFRTGTTGTWIQFFINNIFLDQFSAFINSRNGMIPYLSTIRQMSPVVLKSLTRGVLFKNSKEAAYLKEYIFLAGTSQTFLSGQGADISPQDIRDRLSGKNKSFPKKVVKYFNAIIRFITIPGNVSEIATRGTEYIKARKAGKSQVIALEEAGRVSGSFHHIGRLGGETGRSYVRSLPYSNASLQVLYQTKRALEESPQARARFAIATLSLIAVSVTGLLYLLNQDDDDERLQIMKSLPPELMSKYLFLPSPYSKKELIQIRVPETSGGMAALVNMFILESTGQTKYSWKEYGEAAVAFLPTQVNPFNPIMALFSYIPPLPKGIGEVLTNIKTWPNIRPLETTKDLSLDPEFRYNEYTSLVAIKLGREFGWSPKKIDHLLESTFGRSIKYLTVKPGAFDITKTLKRELYLGASRQVLYYYDIKEKNARKMKQYLDGLKEYSQEEIQKIELTDDLTSQISAELKDYGELDISKYPQKASQIKNNIFKLIMELEEINE